MIDAELMQYINSTSLAIESFKNGSGSSRVVRYQVVSDKPNTFNGWVIEFDGGGNFGSWKTGESETWFKDGAVKITHRQVKARIEIQENEQEIKQAEAKKKANWIWKNAEYCDRHPYLTRKKCVALGVKLYKNSLVIPIYDRTGAICSLQFIDQKGGKRFLGGGKIEGGFNVLNYNSQSPIYLLAEGYSTANTISQSIDLPVFFAFNAGNLKHVASIIKARQPLIKLIICADNDRFLTEEQGGNVGIKKAFEASKSSRSDVIYPIFKQFETGVDFNDLGVERTRKILNEAIK